MINVIVRIVRLAVDEVVCMNERCVFVSGQLRVRIVLFDTVCFDCVKHTDFTVCRLYAIRSYSADSACPCAVKRYLITHIIHTIRASFVLAYLLLLNLVPWDISIESGVGTPEPAAAAAPERDVPERESRGMPKIFSRADWPYLK